MPRTIVIGTDGSEHAEAALRFGGALARVRATRVIVVTAYEHAPAVRGDGGGFERLAREDAQAIAVRGAASLGGGDEVRSSVAVGGTLAGALHAVAELERADLLVVAASSRPRVAGRQPGSVTEHVVHHSPCPVAVVPHPDREPAFARIGVAVDDSAAARAALDEALALCGDDAQLQLVHAEAPADMAYAWPGTPTPAEQVRPGTGWLRALARKAGDRASIVTREGAPSEVLTELSETLDLLVCGSRDQGPVRRLLLGSVSTHLVRHAHCPTVVVPASAGRVSTQSSCGPDPMESSPARESI